MAETILKFEFNPEVAQWKKGQFNISNLYIKDLSKLATINYDKEEDLIQYEDISLYLDDKLYTGGISTFIHNNVSVEFLFDSVLNAYIRNDTEEFNNFGEEWNIFRTNLQLNTTGDKILQVYDGNYGEGIIKTYELQLAKDGLYYYTYEDEAMIVDEKGDIRTNIPEFYFSAFVEEMIAIWTKDEKYSYMNPEVDRWVKDYGGKEQIIADFGE